MPVVSLSIALHTRGNFDVHDITQSAAQSVLASGLQNGIVTLFCPSSTSALTTIEFEPGAVSDLKRLFDEIASPSRHYDHNARWGDGNGHSHLRSALLKPSLTIPFVKGKMTLGTWQQIIFVDFDVRPRNRELVVQILGE